MVKTERYNRTAIFLHWLVGLGILGTLGLGLYMVDLPFSPAKLQIYSWHKWAGMTLLFLAVVRLAWRLSHPAPALPDTMGPLSRLAAHAGHWVLYILMLAIPLSGWLMSSAQGFSVVWFGVLPLPDLVAKNLELGEWLNSIHLILNYTLIATLIGHIGAALHHHFIKKDTVMSRMLPLIKRA
ncbi:Cytochrome b561 homolog 2 [Oligella ureolytica]|uniref:Cytochrome b n=1 Tax=Oligella ureolytica TaxID=90244 RepID=A0A378XHF2_9BURK|nr:cytochrome b [Oligella ureolytica]QPT39784.1 cytochrome b [Oligella ureolytica]SUA52166.1 Cytochrome b561 homolog 2 [Oligella ureolytica]SUA57544.1 Cytochrome b561 homolog 2 [Oligella ureolytica]